MEHQCESTWDVHQFWHMSWIWYTYVWKKTTEAVPQVTNVNRKTSVFHVTSPHLTKSKSLQGRPVRHQVPKAFSLAKLFDGREIHHPGRPNIANAKWLKHIARWDCMNEGRSLDAKQIKLIKQRKDHANSRAKPSTCCGECATQRTCLISHPIKRLYQARRKHITECTWKIDSQGDVTSTSGPTTSTHTYHDTHTPSNCLVCSLRHTSTKNNKIMVAVVNNTWQQIMILMMMITSSWQHNEHLRHLHLSFQQGPIFWTSQDFLNPRTPTTKRAKEWLSLGLAWKGSRFSAVFFQASFQILWFWQPEWSKHIQTHFHHFSWFFWTAPVDISLDTLGDFKGLMPMSNEKWLGKYLNKI